MIPIKQTKFGYPEGNCFAACLASIFEINIDDVPEFPVCPKAAEWVNIVNDWLNLKGLIYVEIDASDAWAYFERSPKMPLCIASGVSPKGLTHAVVSRGWEILHDPHPDGTGIEKIEGFGLFVKLEPEKGGG